MNRFIELLKDKNCIHGIGVDEKIINELEIELNLSFSEEYKEYLKEYGIVACEGHEFSGFTKSKRMNVVNITQRNWEDSELYKRDCYVIEELGIGTIVIWQDEEGSVYRSTYNSFEKAYDSLYEYILSWDK